MKTTEKIIEQLEDLRSTAEAACADATELEGVARAFAFYNSKKSGGIDDDQLKAALERGEKICVWADIEFCKTFSQKDEEQCYAAEEAFSSALGGEFTGSGDGDGSFGHIECYASISLGLEKVTDYEYPKFAVFARKEQATDSVAKAYCPASQFDKLRDVVIYSSPKASEDSIICRFPWDHSNKPTRRNKRVTINCFTRPLFWI